MQKDLASGLMVFADLHIRDDWEQFLQEIFRQLEENARDRILIFAGDVLDKPALLGSSSSLFLDKLLTELEADEQTGRFGFKRVIFLKGTHSHDGAWIDLYQENQEQINNEKIIFIKDLETRIVEGVDFLFIPERYDLSSEVYQRALNATYDVIIGHGTVGGYFKAENSRDETIERTLLSAPVFNVADFKAKFTIFGHYHNFVRDERNNTSFLYVGAFVTNTFGEIDENGKGSLLINKDGEIVRVKNTCDLIYKEIIIRNFDDISESLGLQNSGVRVRAIIDDNTMPTYAKAVANTIRNVKDLRTAKNENDKLNILKEKESLKNFGEIFETFKDKGIIPAILMYASANNFAEINSDFLSNIQKEISVS